MPSPPVSTRPRKRRSCKSRPKPPSTARTFAGTRSAGGRVSGSTVAYEAEAEESGDRQRDEHRPPAERRNEPAAEQRREDGRDGEDEHRQRHQTRRFMPGVKIADDGARDHHHGCSAEALQRPKRHERLDGSGEAAPDRADREKADTDVKGRLATRDVRPRAIDDLERAERQEERRQRHLRRGRGRVQIARDGWKRRQIHVDGERTDSVQQAEDDRHPGERGEHGVS